MRFGLNHTPVVILYPPQASPWEWQAGPEAPLKIVQQADALGFEWTGTGDDIFITTHAAEQMGRRWPEVVSVLAFIAGATERLKVLTNVLVPVHKNPIVLAKSLATLDFLSGGRLLLGIGVGGSVPRGFEAFRIPREARGAMTDEFLKAAKELWTREHPSFHGKYINFDNIVFEPKPVHKPHPPLWIGGNSKAAMRRAAALGDGYMTWESTPETLPAYLDYIRGQPTYGDPKKPFDVIVFGYRLFVERDTHRLLAPAQIPKGKDEWEDLIGKYREVGATGMTVELGMDIRSLEEYLERMEWFAQEILRKHQG